MNHPERCSRCERAEAQAEEWRQAALIEARTAGEERKRADRAEAALREAETGADFYLNSPITIDDAQRAVSLLRSIRDGARRALSGARPGETT